MKKGNKKLFSRDKRRLTQMINLRLNGVALSSLAWLFNCDRDSITKQCEKYGIEPQHVYPQAAPEKAEVYQIERIVSQNLPKTPTYKMVNGERINLGKSYAEYIEENKNRYPPRRNR